MTDEHLQSDTHQTEFLRALLMPPQYLFLSVSPLRQKRCLCDHSGQKVIGLTFSEPPSSLPDNAVSLHLQNISRIGPAPPFPPWDKESIALALLRAGCFHPRHQKSESGHVSPLLNPPHGSHSPRSHLIFGFCLPPSSLHRIRLHGLRRCSSVIPGTVRAQGLCTCYAPAPDVLLYGLMAVPSTPPALFSPDFVSCAHGSRWQDGSFQDAEPGCPGVPLGDGADPLRREPGREQPQGSLHSTPILTRRVSYLTLRSGLAVGGLQCDDCSWCMHCSSRE